MFILAMLQTQAIGKAGKEVGSGLATKVAGFFDYILAQIPNWIAGVVILVVAIFISKMAKAAVEAKIADQVDEENQEVLILAGRVTYVGTLTVGITVALKVMGIDLTTLLAAVAFGIGFALRDLIMNFLAGVFILLNRQFVIGDFIKVGGTVGKVVEIQSRATILQALNGTKVIVPNADIFTKQVTSLTSNPMRRLTIPLYVDYSTDLTFAIKVAINTLRKNSKVLKKPKAAIFVKDYGDSSIDMEAIFWVGRSGWKKIRSGIMKEMWEAFQENGIIVPFNVMHLETAQDTAGEWKEAAEIAKRKKAEMKTAADKAKAAEAAVDPGVKKVAIVANAEQAKAAQEDAAAPSTASAPMALVPAAPQLASVAVPAVVPDVPPAPPVPPASPTPLT